MADAMGISHTSVQRIWKEHGLKPHLVRHFKVSNDPNFIAKVKDIVGLYLDPPDKALVLAVDEKSQIQALDRTQPGLPHQEGPRRHHDTRLQAHGTTTLFAALDVATGTVIGECLPASPRQGVPRIPEEDPARDPGQHLDLHLILDNYARTRPLR